MLRIKTPKSRRAKRELEKHAPKLVEFGKKTILLHGTKTTNVINVVLTEIYHLKKDNAVKFSKRNDSIRPFEAGSETSLEFYSLKNDCNLFLARADVQELHFLPFNPTDKRTTLTYLDNQGKMHRVSKGAPEQEWSSWNSKREGWVKRNVAGPESIADHMSRMGLMALIASDTPGVSRDKCIKMAIVHDIAEAIVGDITPSDGVPKVEKNRVEKEALEQMCKLLGGGPRAEEIHELWMEYEENSTPEAKVVKDFDKIEMILQALEYENGKFQTDLGKAWASDIASRRKKQD